MYCVKASYASEELARKAIHEVKKRKQGRRRRHYKNHDGPRPVRAYLCPYCQLWHLTSASEPRSYQKGED